MKKRVFSGIAYAAILLGVFLLKIFVNDLFFDALIWFMAIVGTFEITRAFGDTLTKTQRVLIFIFAIVVIPACATAEYFFGFGLHVTCVCFFMLSIALVSLLVFRHDETTLENIGASLLAAVYPSLLLTALVLANHVGQDPILENFTKVIGKNSAVFNSDLAITLIFLVSPISDVFALLFGMSFRKFFPKKLAPTLSPNKTVIGFIGGLIGGVISAIGAYFCYNLIVGTGFEYIGMWLPIYAAIGLLAALANCFGDLVESCIKRKKGIKDMGNIMPGHGGVLDRIDGTIYATVAVYACFAVIHLFL